MKRALIAYCSRTGITKGLSYQIELACKRHGVETSLMSIDKFSPEALTGVDYLFLGCWTHGLMIILQHPEKSWVAFARSLPDLAGKRIILFTTYKLAVGSMFRNMRRVLKCKPLDVVLEVKSRGTSLSEIDQTALKEILSN
jgi:flavodoxin